MTRPELDWLAAEYRTYRAGKARQVEQRHERTVAAGLRHYLRYNRHRLQTSTDGDQWQHYRSVPSMPFARHMAKDLERMGWTIHWDTFIPKRKTSR